ncbi:hypothetical protein [Sporosarcina aquimarina]|uniref:Thiamine pyrophosphate enzyme central domain-containing protein n=1 Tax=Sporosarcina aquimarina TaxID=114975 RepID=A0ABU4FVZ5_9BACL|nr:hypothetical protein [Sporosarcina aquimarina]MDW0108889.1 hypothetical protein [Sporosarcina aquimarina]
MKPFAVYSANLANPDATVDLLQRAARVSLGQRNVTHLSVPKDFFTAPAKGETMILAGAGTANASTELEKLAECWGAGILISLGKKGVLDESSPNKLQGIGEGGYPYAKDLFKEADVVLLAGTTWWPEGYVPTDARIIRRLLPLSHPR